MSGPISGVNRRTSPATMTVDLDWFKPNFCNIQAKIPHLSLIETGVAFYGFRFCFFCAWYSYTFDIIDSFEKMKNWWKCFGNGQESWDVT